MIDDHHHEGAIKMTDNKGETDHDGKKRVNKRASRLWVPVVLLIGAVLGFACYVYLFYMTPLVIILGSPPPTRFVGSFLFGRLAFLQFHIILSTISISLLVALLVVYARTYVGTKANFILGLVIVLFALLLQSLTQYPLLHELVNNYAIESVTFYSPVSDIFTIVAYTVFLYLSLE